MSARGEALEAAPYFEVDEALDGYTQYHAAISYFDNIAFSCYNAFKNELGSDHFSDLFSSPQTKIPINLLYNFGFMWIDFVNYTFYTYENVPQEDWGFFFFYLFGDFTFRFLYNSSDAEEWKLSCLIIFNITLSLLFNIGLSGIYRP